MKARILLAAAMLFSIGLNAQDRPAEPQPARTRLRPDTTIFLYPKGQEADFGVAGGPLESNGMKKAESIDGNGILRNVGDFARFELYLPNRPNGQMVVILPGGAYWITASYSEGLYAAQWFIDRGITAAVLEYRMPWGHDRVPLTDVQNTFRWCRAHAAELGVDQIGIMGSSAGGHLAATASNLYADELTRPDFAILFYPVISMKDGITHEGSRNNLLRGKVSDPAMVEKYSMEEQVTENTPATYLVLCEDDDVVDPRNGMDYFLALRKHGVPAEMHVFPTGGHGWGFNTEDYVETDRFKYARPVLELSLQGWLAGVHQAK